PQPGTPALASVSPSPGTNTATFTSPNTGAKLTLSLVGLTNTVTLSSRWTLVDPLVAQSDPTVFSFNPGNPLTTSVGNMPCDTVLPGAAVPPHPNTCEVIEIEANPN